MENFSVWRDVFIVFIYLRSFFGKFNGEGNVIWMQTYQSGEEYDEVAGDAYFLKCNFIQCKDGGYLLVGISKGKVATDDYDLPWIVKTDSLGVMMWKRYVYSENNYLYDVKELSSEEFVLCGRYNSINDMLYEQAWLFKTSSGDNIWEKTIGGKGGDYFTGLQLADEDNFILLGYSSSTDSSFSSNHDATDILLMQVSAANSIAGYTFNRQQF